MGHPQSRRGIGTARTRALILSAISRFATVRIPEFPGDSARYPTAGPGTPESQAPQKNDARDTRRQSMSRRAYPHRRSLPPRRTPFRRIITGSPPHGNSLVMPLVSNTRRPDMAAVPTSAMSTRHDDGFPQLSLKQPPIRGKNGAPTINPWIFCPSGHLPVDPRSDIIPSERLLYVSGESSSSCPTRWLFFYALSDPGRSFA